MAKRAILVPEAPAIPGLAFRSFDGEGDYPKMIEVLRASKDADRLEDIDTLEDLARDYAHLVKCDKETDMQFVEVDGETVGYGRVFFETEGSGKRIYWNYCFLKPEWRRRKIGNAMCARNEKRASEIEAVRAERGPAEIWVSIRDHEEGKRMLFERRGYRPVRHFFEMVRPDLENLPDAPLPAGIEIRPFEEGQYPLVWAAMHEAFKDHWSSVEPTEGDYLNWVEWSSERDERRAGWVIAWDVASNEIAGMVLGFILGEQNEKFLRRRGWAEEISVRRPWRKRALASAMIVACLRSFKARGMSEAALGVDSQNESGALGLYERLGFRTVARDTFYGKAVG
jgi:ribosomal protein S18 acetylase RimI-like enzyme